MAIDAIGLYAQATGKVTTEANGKLGKEDFLKLLVAQMRYQDPLEPMKDSEFVAQTAQFSSLEAQLDINASMTAVQTMGMMGRNIMAYAADGSTIMGKVVSVDMTGPLPALWLEDNTLVALKDVFRVTV